MFAQYQIFGMQLLFIGVIFFFYKSGESMLDTTVRPYLLQVVCFKKYPGNESECLSRHNQEISDDVQKEASVYLFLYRLAANIPAVVTGLYLGAWSDKHGRRLPMVFSCAGTILAVVIYMCSMYVKVKSTCVWIILAGTLLQGFSGKGVVPSMIVNCFISEFSNDSYVTKHTGMLFSMNFFGNCFGALLAGISEWSLLASFATVIGLNSLCVLIVLIFVEESKNKNEMDTVEFAGKKTCSAEIKRTKSYNVGEYCSKDHLKRPTSEKQLDSHAKENEHYSASGDKAKQNPLSCCIFFNGFKSYWTVATKMRRKRNKLHIVILLLFAFISTCDLSGSMDVLLLFVARGPFNWSNSLYSFFVASENILIGVTLVVMLPFLSIKLKLSDFKLIVIGLLCKIVRYICIAVSTQTWMVFVLNIVWSGNSFFVCVRSLLSKCVEEDELGKIFSIYSAIETAGKFIGSIAYLSFYGATVSTAPSITFFLMGFMNIILVIALVGTRKIFENTDRFEVVPMYVKGTSSSSAATDKISQSANSQQ